MALTERLAILIDANGAQAVSEFRKVGDAANKSLGAVEDRTSRVAKQLQTIGAGAVGVGGALTFGLTRAVDKASELEQAVGAAESVFGSAIGPINEFGKSSAQSVGLATAAFSQMSAQIGALLQGFGFTQQESAQLSIQLVKTGADLAAAFGGTTEEAITAIGAALRGERDPIEKYGVAFNEASVQAKIAALGLDTHTAAAEQNAKATAALAIIQERTANVQGQFARESDTLAGKQQRAAAEAQNAAAQLGQGFAPVMIKVTELTNSGSKAFIAFDDALNGIPSSVAAIGTVSLDVVGSLATVVGLLLQYKVARAASAGAAASEATSEVLAAAAKSAGVGATTAATAAEVRYAGALQASTVSLGEATGAQLALNGAKVAGAGTGLAGLAGAAVPIGLTAAAIFGAAKAVDYFVNNGNDMEAQMERLTTLADNELVPAFDRLSLGGIDAAGAFRAFAEADPEGATHLVAALEEAGRNTEEFIGILQEVTGEQYNAGKTTEELARYYSALSAAYRDAAESTQVLAASSAGLTTMLDNIRQASNFRIGAFDATDSFNAVYEAQKKVTGSTRDYRSEQHALEQATKRVTEAQEDLTEAEVALFLARLGPTTRDITNAELDRADAALDLRDAQNALTDAQRAYNEALKEGDKEDIADTRRELERANINLRRSQLANEDAQKDYNDVLNSGSEESAKVKEANERLKEAQERLTDAQYAAEEAQRRITEGAAAGATAVADYGAKAGAAAKDQMDYVQSLIDAGAPQSTINEALKVAAERIGKLRDDYGDVNPRLAEYLRLIKEIANFEDANAVAFATSAGGQNIVIRKRDVPGYKPPYDLSSPSTSQMSTQGLSAGGGSGTIIVQLDGKPIVQSVVDYSQLSGGVPIVIRTPG